MALIKPFTTPHRVTATYHKLLKADFDCQAQVVNLAVAIYASADARENNGAVLWHEYPSVPFVALTRDPRSALYPILADYWNSYLKGAESDMEVPAADPVVVLTHDATVPIAPPPEAEPIVVV